MAPMELPKLQPQTNMDECDDWMVDGDVMVDVVFLSAIICGQKGLIFFSEIN